MKKITILIFIMVLSMNSYAHKNNYDHNHASVIENIQNLEIFAHDLDFNSATDLFVSYMKTLYSAELDMNTVLSEDTYYTAGAATLNITYFIVNDDSSQSRGECKIEFESRSKASGLRQVDNIWCKKL